MSLIRESLKKVQEEDQNDKTTATLISSPPSGGGKKVPASTFILIGIGLILIAGAAFFLYRPGPTRPGRPAAASAPKPAVVAQAASNPAVPANPGPGPALPPAQGSAPGTVPTPVAKGPAPTVGLLPGSLTSPRPQGKTAPDPQKEKLVEASVLGAGPARSGSSLGSASLERGGQEKEGPVDLAVQPREKSGPGPKAKGAFREVPAAARMGSGQLQDSGGQEVLKQSYQQAYIWQQEGKTNQALSRYREILAQDPYNPYVLTNLGLMYQQTGNLKEAISLYEKAIESDPKFVPAAQNLGVAWMKAGNSEEAARWLERSLALQPDNANALVNLGILYKKRGNRETARQYFKKAWEFNNKLPEVSYNLARLEEEAGNIPEAYRFYQQFIRIRNDPQDKLVQEVQAHVQGWRVFEPGQK